MWVTETSDQYERRHKRYTKKEPNVLKAILNNLDTYFKALQFGVLPQKIQFGFIHAEPHGVKAIDQKGGEGKLAQGRLYVYPDADAEVLYLITLGDKDSQDEDIQYCNQFIRQLREEKTRGPEDRQPDA